MMTPFEKLKSLPLAKQFLKPGITFQQLDAQASAMSDNEAAERLNKARATLGALKNQVQHFWERMLHGEKLLSVEH